MTFPFPCLVLLAVMAPGLSPEATAGENGDYVVLLHGSGRTALSMKWIEWHLRRRGYRVINETYPSQSLPVPALADDFLRNLLACRINDSSATVHFVTHSLGGIIVRQYFVNHSPPNPGRVVMLAPPNQGSEIIDHLRGSALLRKILGPGRLFLGTAADDLPKRLGPVRFECGVIAGDRSLNPFLSAMLPGTSDGEVTVESAKVAGMRDFLVLHSSHTWLMWRRETVRQTCRFLETGAFDHSCRQ